MPLYYNPGVDRERRCMLQPRPLIFTARRYSIAFAVYAVVVCLSVCTHLSVGSTHAGIVLQVLVDTNGPRDALRELASHPVVTKLAILVTLSVLEAHCKPLSAIFISAK